ncbi:uncharacterized protein LOC126836664 [Adelges cooleyi]|uniref:uncharacterized protein LOC126836664 n=2 Tax=Adelges cooleyi TaxID=133065 RepID=UPI00217F4828|nr:uncharacterized protein LOC126836664 [Adelges cooleyi]
MENLDVNVVLKRIPEEMRALRLRRDKAKRELAELEMKEKDAVKKLMEVTVLKKKENDAILKAAHESLGVLVKKVNERKTRNDYLIKKINKKRNTDFVAASQDTEEAINHAEMTRDMMEKLKEQTEIVESQAALMKRTRDHKMMVKEIRGKISSLKTEIAQKQQEIKMEIDAYRMLDKLCQDINAAKNKKIENCNAVEKETKKLTPKLETLRAEMKRISMD